MKKIILLLLVLIACQAYSQTGNVGINTTTPTETLDVATGNVRIRNINSVTGTASNNLVVADATGVLKTIVAAPGSVQLIKEAIGTTPQTIAAGATADINGATITFTTTAVTTALITYSALPVPANAAAPVQGTIDLIVDGVKIISSYYSATDAPSSLVKLGNYSTSQKVISNFPAGTHTIKLQAKSWVNSTNFNIDPVASGYGGALPSDSQSFKSRISVIALN